MTGYLKNLEDQKVVSEDGKLVAQTVAKILEKELTPKGEIVEDGSGGDKLGNKKALDLGQVSLGLFA